MIENHMVIGPPEPPDTPMDIDEMRIEMSHGCKHLVDGECHFDPDDWSTMCHQMEVCPDGRWS